MIKFNFTSKAVIVAMIAVISYSALEANAEGVDSPVTEVTDINFNQRDYDIRRYVESEHFMEEVECLARNIYYESRGEPIDGQEWVAWVTINRSHHEDYPSTICSVVHQCNSNNVCQFSWVRYNRNSIPEDEEAWEQSIDIAINVLLGEKFGDSFDPTDGAIMFHSVQARPRWRHSYELVDQIGSHIFYKDRA